MIRSNLQRLTFVALVALGALAFATTGYIGAAQSPAPSNQPAAGPSTTAAGLVRNAPGAFQGYTLISPDQATAVYMVDMQGRVVHSWETGRRPGAYGYLLENGNMLRSGDVPEQTFGGFVAGGGGRIQEYAWNGDLVWDFTYWTPNRIPHHDFLKLPNGNVLLLVKEKKTPAESAAAGRNPSTVQADLQPDALMEIKPTGKTTGDVVWEWHLWDHMIQDRDSAMANFGEVAAHPERLDINYTGSSGQRGGTADWAHANGIAYNAKLNEVMISARTLNEVYIIDHSTTTREAAGKTGGRQGKGGDFLYRWGSPAAYRRGTAEDQRLFGQHNPQWIADGLRGAGNLLLFNNGDSRTGDKYSTVEEVVLPVDASGRYTLEAGKKYGPADSVWSYAAPNRTDFYSYYISGVQRLPNGNTLICSGATGRVFEVTPGKQVVWEYKFPSFGPTATGGPAPRGGGANNPQAVFRAYRYAADFPGLVGKTLTPGKSIEDFVR